MDFLLLGPLEVHAGGQRIDLGTPKQRAVLAMMALTPGRVVAVDRLIDELWPDEPPASALASLQAYVSRLRRALAPDGRTARSGVVMSRAPGYLLDVPPESVDAIRFVRLVKAGRSALVEGDAPAALTTLDGALAMWGGDPLPELAEGPLGQAERSRLSELRRSAREDRFEALLRLGRPGEVLADVESALAEAPYAERLWRQLMLALYRSGRQGEALATYRRAQQRFDDDLGISPGPSLRQLHRDILREEVEPVPLVLREPEADRDGTIAPAGLVGRKQELETVQRALAAATGGQGSLLLVTGDPGIGKSAVLEALTVRAGAMGGVVATGQGIDSDPAPAYLPWAQALRVLVTAVGGEAVAAAFEPYGNVPAVLDPSLADIVRLPPAEQLADTELARTRLFQGLVDGLRRLSRVRPLVLIIDDAQWLDSASVLLVQLLASRLVDARIVLVLAYRDRELPPDVSLARALPALRSHRHAIRLPLTGLPRRAVAALSESVAGAALPSQVLDVIVDRTGGNPFFVHELVRVLAAEHAIEDSVRAGDRVPVRVQEVVRQRLSRLPEQVNAMLSVAAVLGRDVDGEVLRELLKLEPEALYDVMDTAVVTGFLETTGDGHRLRFAHDLVRETVYLDISPLRRARLHARCLDVLAATSGTSAAELAHHISRAVPVVQALDAVPVLAEAAAEAYERRAYEQAGALLAEGLRLLTEAPVGERRDRAELDVRGRIAFMHQSTDGYLAPAVAEQYDAMRPLLERVVLDVDVLPALWGWASYTSAAGHPLEAVQMARAGLARGTSDSWATVVAQTHEGFAAWDAGDLVAARDHLASAAQAAPPGQLPLFPIVRWDPLVGVLCPLAVVASMLDDSAAAAHSLDVAQQSADRVGRDFMRMYVALHRAVVASYLDDAAAALQPAQWALAVAERRGFVEYVELGRVYTGWARARSGDESGLALTRAVVAAVDPRSALWHRWVAMHADALLVHSRLDEAVALLSQALEWPCHGRGVYAEADILFTRSQVWRTLGRDDAALADEGRALAVARDTGYAAVERRAARLNRPSRL